MNVYYDPKHPASFSGWAKFNPLFPGQNTKEWLEHQDAYTLHAPLRKNFPRKQYYVTTRNELVQGDLADFQNVSKYNHGFRYVLCLIDVFSRYVWTYPVKNKNGETIASVLKHHFDNVERVPIYFQTDLGTEFYNRHVKKVLNEFDIKHYSVDSDKKAAIVERAIRTLKQKLYRYFTRFQTYRYIDVLADVVQSYNNTVHRSIKMAPAEVSDDRVRQVYNTLYENKPVTSSKFKFSEGMNVRVSKLKSLFEKGYYPNYTREIFTISKRIPSVPPTYRLKDLNGEELKGIFYEQELQRVRLGADSTFLVQKVLKRRGNKLYVSWVGFPSTFNSWINKSDIVQ